jgi:uncharacterized membrane protein
MPRLDMKLPFQGDESMNTKTAILAAAIGGLVAFAGPAEFAADEGKSAAATEKCYGVAKAGKNDCAGTAHSCQGQGKKDGDAKEWVKLPKGTCERIVGGTLTAAAK